MRAGLRHSPPVSGQLPARTGSARPAASPVLRSSSPTLTCAPRIPGCNEQIVLIEHQRLLILARLVVVIREIADRVAVIWVGRGARRSIDSGRCPIAWSRTACRCLWCRERRDERDDECERDNDAEDNEAAARQPWLDVGRRRAAGWCGRDWRRAPPLRADDGMALPLRSERSQGPPQSDVADLAFRDDPFLAINRHRDNRNALTIARRQVPRCPAMSTMRSVAPAVAATARVTGFFASSQR